MPENKAEVPQRSFIIQKGIVMNIIENLLAYFNLKKTSSWVVWPLAGSTLLALVVLAVEREILFQENLFDMEGSYEFFECSEAERVARTADGRCNDINNPEWGMAGKRFGRNVDPELLPTYVSDEEILTPNPREVSRKLMTREEFIPATQINVLATAWIQFMIHDWFDHGDPQRHHAIKVPIAKDDPDFTARHMKVRRTRPASGDDNNSVVTYRNEVTHWWDGSQIYGSDQDTQNQLRTFVGGKLKMEQGRLPTKGNNRVLTGFNKNWWVGLTMFHNIFVREHNRTADILAAQYPEMNDQQLFDKARLITSALMAKIHTVEWTPALLDNPVLIAGLNSNWYGLNDPTFAGLIASVAPFADTIAQLFGSTQGLNIEKMGDKAQNGIVGGPTDDYGVPFTLTEEFVSVYRMHPLLPDYFSIRNVQDNAELSTIGLGDVREGDAADIIDDYGFANMWYSFGTEHPGALTLFNYPRTLQHIDIPLLGDIDLAAVDLIRDRERAVLRYNDFRAAIRLEPIAEFEDLFRRFKGQAISAEHQAIADQLREVYGTVDQLDVLTGSLAEGVRPGGFAFGETSFQIFTLMASRRILSDRFYTVDYTPEMYTPEGYAIVQTRTMTDILRDHFPELAANANIPANAFKPWTVSE